MMKNEKVVLVKKGQLELHQAEMPVAGPGEVVVQVSRVGICGSDVEYWKQGAIGDFVLRSPMVIGHESAGTVVAVGPNVDAGQLSVGDRVAMEPGVGCGHCQQCKTGRYNLCPHMKFFATPPVDGSLCRYIAHPAHLCFRLPASVSDDEGALCEPLSVGVHACRRAGVQPGHSVAILGCGPIGLICCAVAKAFGAARVVMTDVREDRLQFARTFGADHAVSADGQADLNQQIVQLNGGRPVDAAIECSGFTGPTTTAIQVTRSGGCVVCVGLHDPVMSLPLMDANVREVDIRGIFRYCNTYPTCISLLQDGRVNVKPLITHRFPFSDFLRGFETAADPNSGSIKVMFEI